MKYLILILSLSTYASFEDVESYFNDDELSKVRNQSEFEIDQCHDVDNISFGDSIEYFITKLANKRPTFLHVASIYNMPSKIENQEAVGLLSHPLCLVSKESLSQTIKKVPDGKTIELANRFASEHNEYRSLAQRDELKKLWGKFFGCLAYTESLTTADTKASKRLAKKYGPRNYEKPEGVKFYYDKWQPKVSRLNIGLFQFTPNYAGNIKPCVDSWNHFYQEEKCQIKNNGQDNLIRVFGSTTQQFNVYCGVHKVIQAFSVQLNTQTKKYTHPSNTESGKLKESNKRCVSPHFYAGWSYNHFGPLQNSTGDNLRKLMSCIFH